MAWMPTEPYDSLPPLPPSIDLETKAVLKHCVTARAALAELKQAVELIPNPAMLINTLPVLEARASSEIENIVTTADRLFQHLHAEGAADPATKEALSYRHALLEGFGTLAQRPIGTGTAEAVCSRIRGITMQVRRLPGTALANTATGQVIYTPPHGEEKVRDLLSNWEQFLHSEEEIDPLVRMAAAHYQFEAIHPFSDGNGRTGRILNNLFLVQQGLLPLPVLYLSRYITRTKDDYYRYLLAVTSDAAWEPWIIYMLQGVSETAAWTTSRIGAIRDFAREVATLVQERLPKIYTRELVDVIFEQPYCRIANVVEAGVAKRQAASRYLKAMSSIGVLEERSVGREKLFVNTRLLELLTTEG
jgi:cell filamentation protein, protein adenylyltransferase